MIDKGNTLGKAELGILPQYLDGECHLVGHALTGTVSAGEQLKVFDSVVLSVAVPMVDGLVLGKRTTDVLRHDVSVLKNFMPFAGDSRGNVNPDISIALDVPSVVAAMEFFSRSFGVVFALAFRAAKSLLSIDCISFESSPLDKGGSTIFARSLVAIIRGASASCVRALHVAVHRIAIPLLAVGVHEPLLHREGLAAELTSERNRIFVGGGAPVGGFVGLPTLSPTKSLLGVAGTNFKSVTALLADLIDRHLKSPFIALQNRNDYARFADAGQLI